MGLGVKYYKCYYYKAKNKIKRLEYEVSNLKAERIKLKSQIYDLTNKIKDSKI